VGYCGAEHQRADWPAHNVVCRKSEFGVVSVLSWERVLTEAATAAPASLAAIAALPPIPDWNVEHDGAPPTKIMRAWRKAAEGGHAGAQTSTTRTNAPRTARRRLSGTPAKAAAQCFAGAQNNLGIL
jgi:hypothetical protein